MIDYYQPGVEGSRVPAPAKVTVALHTNKPGVSPHWQAELGGVLNELAKHMLSPERIPRVIYDGDKRIIGSIIIE